MSTDGGSHWKILFVGSTLPVGVIEIDPLDPKTVYVGVGPRFIHRTTDRGQTWTLLPPVPGDFLISLSIAASNDSILYATYWSGGLFKSTDKGNTWTQMPFIASPNPSLVLVDSRDANVVYTTIINPDTARPNGIFKSTDGGESWIGKNNGLGVQNREVGALTQNPRNKDDLFIGVESNDSTGEMIFRTTNGGDSWFKFSNGLPVGGGGVRSIAIDTVMNRVYAAVLTWPNEDGVYILDSLTTDVNTIAQELPTNFSLYQNYPNPFNPSTRIRFEINRSGFVSLKIYDLGGREVTTLIAKNLQGGEHEAEWNAEGHPSGPYFYQMRFESNVESRKMILVK